jgi:hypothetical protein
MTPLARAFIVAAVCSLPLGGCVNFDPMDWMAGEWFSTKKPLPGERKALFPEGVPGVSKGVPQELMKGNQAVALQDQQAETPAVILPEEPKPKPKPKARPKPKPQVAKQQPAEPESRPTAVTVRPQGGQQPKQQWPDPPAQRPQQQTTQWPDPPAAKQQKQVQWPDPPGQTRPAAAGGGGGVQWPDPPAPR